MLKLGTSKCVITPNKPLFLCGYADRTEPFTNVLEDIYLRILAFKDENTKVIIVNADLLWWNEDVIKILEKKLLENKIDSNSVLFTATHNHSGPGLGKTFIEHLEKCDDEYRSFLVDLVIKQIHKAEENYEEVALSASDDILNLNVYRRVMEDGEIKMKPNYTVPADHHLTLIKATRKDGSVKSMILHYPCHANISKENVIQPDWPGSALNMIDAEFSNCTSIFLQGFTGDLRPNCVVGDSFVPCNREKILLFASSFKNKIDKMSNNTQEIPSTITSLVKTNTNLPLDQDNIDREASSEAEKLWKIKIAEKNKRDYEVLKLSYFSLGGYTLVFFNAEVVQSYAQYARTFGEHVICSGYTDGMIGYLANTEQIKEGGYESKGSAIYFALAGTYSPEIETIIKNKIEGELKWKKEK